MPASSAEIVTPIVKLLLETGAGTLVVKLIERAWKERKEEKAKTANLNAALIYDELNALKRRVGAGRVLLLYTSNGGGIPDAGKQIYCSILYEVTVDGLSAIKKDWQNMPTDEGYIQMLKEVIMNKFWRGSPATMKSGFLKDLYMSEKVDHSVVVPVYKTEKQFFYLSMRWYSHEIEANKVPTDETIRVALATATANITHLLGGNQSEFNN